MPAEDVMEAASERFSEKTLRNASERAAWMWRLPEHGQAEFVLDAANERVLDLPPDV